ncbi:MAG: substrate-binding domain-containing protein [Oscillospiraceae bacterium]|nr:substrate-binding domain-containing protein [Oscillospiraceae bacterium]
MKRMCILLPLLALTVLLFACRSGGDIPSDTPEPTAPPTDEIPILREEFAFTRDNFPRMDGSPSTMPIAEALAAVMLGESRENVRELAVFTRTTSAYLNLANGLCDILIAGEPSPGVMSEISLQDFRYDMAPIATDALVFVVSISNPVSNLSTNDIKAIYSGEITGWQEIGGDDIEIMAFQRNEDAASQILMEKLVMDWQKMMEPPMQSIRAGHAEDAVTAIRGFDNSANAIGYTTYHYAANMGMADGLKILSIDGVMPSADTISSGAYPFINPYYAVIDRDLPEDDPARILYNWLQTDEGQALITSQGYVSNRNSPIEFALETIPEMKWNVSTDSSALIPYDSPRSKFTRAGNFVLSDLIPSNDYGSLLPYGSAITMNDGGIYTTKYGFVTENGMVVTDPVYDNIRRAVYTSPGGESSHPVYYLQKDVHVSGFDRNYLSVYAACAADGSWITPFGYVNIAFRQDVMFLMYDHDSFDIDVYDYNGNFLYNILDLPWARRISVDTWPEEFVYSVSEGYGFILLDDETYALMDVLTGQITETDFAAALYFSDGLAAVTTAQSNGLWGFVDTSLDFAIAADYIYGAAFMDDRAVVESPTGEQRVINKKGEVLHTVDAGHIIVNSYDGQTYTVYSHERNDFPVLLTNTFDKIDYPAGALPYTPESSVSYAGNGFYLCTTENGVWLFSASDVYPLSLAEKRYVNDFANGFIRFFEFDDEFVSVYPGIMTPDGFVIISPEKDALIEPVTFHGDTVGFAVNTGSFRGSFIGSEYRRTTFKYVGTDGLVIKSDLGILSYDEVSGLLYVQGTDYSAWCDLSGNTLISIPSMGYTYD